MALQTGTICCALSAEAFASLCRHWLYPFLCLDSCQLCQSFDRAYSTALVSAYTPYLSAPRAYEYHNPRLQADLPKLRLDEVNMHSR